MSVEKGGLCVFTLDLSERDDCNGDSGLASVNLYRPRVAGECIFVTWKSSLVALH